MTIYEHMGVRFEFEYEPVSEEHLAAARSLVEQNDGEMPAFMEVPLDVVEPGVPDPLGQVVVFTGSGQGRLF